MSIASEVTRLQGAKSTLKTKLNAINDEQHQITDETLDEYGGFVDSISTGGTGNPYEKLDEFFGNTIKHIKTDVELVIPCGYNSGGSFYYANCVFFSTKNAKNSLQVSALRNSPKLKYVNVGKVTLIQNSSLLATSNLKSLILLNSSQIPLQGTNAFQQSAVAAGTGYVYVDDSLLSSYKGATNWVTYASQIKGFSEAPTYDATVTYAIGDVCKYNNKFYGYCKEDLTSSTGNAPTGTNQDNNYWEYIGEITV